MSNISIQEAFLELCQILDRLMGPGGCPWDQNQTLETLRSGIIEEACEVVEAIDLNDKDRIREELGDLLLNAVFAAKVAEKYALFELKQVITLLNDKLVRRHPHVFGQAHLENQQQVLEQWEDIKKSEKSHADRHSILDGIPKGLSSLARAQKLLHKIDKLAPSWCDHRGKKIEFNDTKWESEEQLGEWLLEMVRRANYVQLDADAALRSACTRLEQEFKEWEQAVNQRFKQGVT